MKTTSSKKHFRSKRQYAAKREVLGGNSKPFSRPLSLLSRHSKNIMVNKVKNIRDTLDLWFRDRNSCVAQFGEIAQWKFDKQITNMSYLFRNYPDFNEDISQWKMNHVTNMEGMFDGCIQFNKPIGMWNVKRCTNMNYMFRGATSFNQDLSGWQSTHFISLGRSTTKRVESMEGMFEGASSFNSPIHTWNVKNVWSMKNMFRGAIAFNQDINVWDTKSLMNCSGMFDHATSFNSPIHTWDMSNVIDTSFMFYNAASFDQSIRDWQMGSNWKFAQGMFSQAVKFNQPFSVDTELDRWTYYVKTLQNMRHMFAKASAFFQNLHSWNFTDEKYCLKNNTCVYDGMLFETLYDTTRSARSHRMNPVVNDSDRLFTASKLFLQEKDHRKKDFEKYNEHSTLLQDDQASDMETEDSQLDMSYPSYDPPLIPREKILEAPYPSYDPPLIPREKILEASYPSYSPPPVPTYTINPLFDMPSNPPPPIPPSNKRTEQQKNKGSK